MEHLICQNKNILWIVKKLACDQTLRSHKLKICSKAFIWIEQYAAKSKLFITLSVWIGFWGESHFNHMQFKRGRKFPCYLRVSWKNSLPCLWNFRANREGAKCKTTDLPSCTCSKCMQTDVLLFTKENTEKLFFYRIIIPSRTLNSNLWYHNFWQDTSDF